MPVLPEFDESIPVRPTEMPGVNPAAFGAPGAAIAQGGRELSDQMAQFNERYIDAKRAMAASNTVVGLSKTLDDLQHKYSKVPDRTQALAGFNAETAALQKSSVDTIADPEIRAHVTEQFGAEAISRSDAVGREAFGLESSKHQADLTQNQSDLSTLAARAPNDHARAIITDNFNAAVAGAVAGGWITPEEAKIRQLKWTSDVQAVHVRDQMNAALDTRDPEKMYALAHSIQDQANYPGMTEDTRASLGRELENSAYHLDMQAARREAHADMMADRAMHQAQAHNEAVTLAAVNAGQPLSDVQIMKLANGGQISAGGVEALHTARDRAEDGRDNPIAAGHLWHAADSGELVPDDVYTAFKHGDVSKGTMVDLIKTIDSKNIKGDTASDKAAFSVLKTALSGAAVESGSILGNDKAGAQQTWAEAQGEWHRRVTIGGEDSNAVLTDMIPKYAKAPIAPTWIAPTKFGTPNSTKDVMALAARLGQAFKSKQISQSDFEGQAELLTNYRRYYAQEDQAARARSRKVSVQGVQPGGDQ